MLPGGLCDPWVEITQRSTRLSQNEALQKYLNLRKTRLMARPTSRYLYSMVHETPPCRLNLSGSTPPFPASAEFFADMNIPFAYEEIDQVSTVIKELLARHVNGAADEFRFAPGSSSVYTQALATVSKTGDRVLVESPAYDPFPTCAEFLGLKVEFFNRTFDIERDFAAVKKASKRCQILVLSNPNCPTGRLSTRDELLSFSRLFKWVIIDEVFLPLFSDGKMSILSGGIPRNVILIGSLSKSIGLSAARFGWLRAEPKVAMNFERVGYNFHIEMPSFSLAAARLALQNWDQLIESNLRALEKPRAIFREFGMSRAGYSQHNLFSHDLQSGHFATLRIPKKFRSGDAFAERILRETGVWLRPARLFRLPTQVRLHFFMSEIEAEQLKCEFERYYT